MYLMNLHEHVEHGPKIIYEYEMLTRYPKTYTMNASTSSVIAKICKVSNLSPIICLQS